jgi:hypothetical protein
MKNNVKKISYLILTLIFIISCQIEEDITEGKNPNTNTNNSETTNYYERIGMYDGSFDDVMDNNSCSSVILPVSLFANNVPLTINNTTEYKLIEDIFNQSTLDQDSIVINFPITTINYDYSKTVITNQQQLEDLQNLCNNNINNNLIPITCIDIQFPIKISLFDTKLEQSSIVDINTDQELFIFMTNLSINEVYSIQYPINIFTNENITISVSTDSQLKSIINDCI